jgi:hypothetical protein
LKSIEGRVDLFYKHIEQYEREDFSRFIIFSHDSWFHFYDEEDAIVYKLKFEQ